MDRYRGFRAPRTSLCRVLATANVDAYARERPAAYKRLREYQLLDVLPKGATVKVLKREPG